MQELGIFKARHPVTGHKRRKIDFIDPELDGPEIITELSEVSDAEKFQHIDCGAMFVTVDMLECAQRKMPCPHCLQDTLLSQLQVMGLGDDADLITNVQRYDLLKRAIAGFGRNRLQQSAVHALKHMLSLRQFHRLINHRQYGKDISLLEFAIIRGDENALLALIDAGAHVNTSSFLMRTPLHFAVERKKAWAIRILLEHGADPYAFHYYQETPLEMCVRLFDSAINERDKLAYAAVLRALRYGMVVYDSRMDALEKQHGNQGENQLHFAVRALDVVAVRNFLAMGGNPNLPNNGGFTPVMYLFTPLCVGDSLTIARILFECTDLTLENNAFKSVFYYAVTSHSDALCLELFRVGARRIPGFSAYCRTALANMFLDQNNELNIGFLSLRLFLYCCQGITDANDQESILHIAVRVLPETPLTSKFISWLVYAKAPFAETRLGLKNPNNNPTHYVLSDTDVNETDSQGESAVFLAIRLGKLRFLQHLAEPGNNADFTQRNHNDEFPLNVARELGDEGVIDFVRQQSHDAIQDSYEDERCGDAEQALSAILYEPTDEQVRLMDAYRGNEEMSQDMESDEVESEQVESPRFGR